MRHRLALLLCVALVITGVVTACKPAAAPAGKPKIIVGSKAFTEQLLVGNMVAHLMEANGYPVEKKIGLGGTALVHEALANGEVNVYVEYTGTGLTTILKEEAMSDPDKVYEKVKAAYKEKFNLVWLKSWGFNNTYALVMRKEQADELKVSKISELKPHGANLVFACTQEFATRPDGLPNLSAMYDVTFKDVKSMDPGLMYSACAEKQVDVISGFATDGRIPALDLVVLEDDMGYFPPYYAAPVVRQDLLDKSPEVAEILDQLAGKIDDLEMAKLNYEVDGKQRTPEEVAQEYLKNAGLIK